MEVDDRRVIVGMDTCVGVLLMEWRDGTIGDDDVQLKLSAG